MARARPASGAFVETLTVAQIRRRTCYRCKTPRSGHATWSFCADGNRPRVLCWLCDLEMNGILLIWIRDVYAEAKFLRYRRKGAARGPAPR